MRRFSHFACIDWSGAAGEYLPGLALAVTDGPRDVRLIEPDRRWSRAAIADWLADQFARGSDMLIGLDLSLGFPFLDCGAYFPGWDASPPDARALWQLVDSLAGDDSHFGAHRFLAHAEVARHFRQRGATGDAFAAPMGRWRVTEHGQAAAGLRPYSCFNLVGAAQVGKSSLTGMRVLHHLGDTIAVWPFDPLPPRGPVIVEIYTTLAARAVGRRTGRSKIRDAAVLDQALAALDAATPDRGRPSDHQSDALLTAAWLRHVANRQSLWQPGRLSPHVAATEGWTFGIE